MQVFWDSCQELSEMRECWYPAVFAWLAAEVPTTHRPAIWDLSRKPRTTSHTVDALDGALAPGFQGKMPSQTTAGLLTASSIPVSTAGRRVMPSSIKKKK